jgi:hypothetical protein
MSIVKCLNLAVSRQIHERAVQSAHNALAEGLRRPTWGADDFYSAMAVYREVAGIEFAGEQDAMLDKWLNGADIAWKEEIDAKGDAINLGEALEKAITAARKAIDS